MRTTSWLLLTAALLAGAPSVATAQTQGSELHIDDSTDDAALALLAVTGAAYVGFEATLVALAFDRPTDGPHLDLGWAFFETAWGAANAAGSAVLLHDLFASHDSGSGSVDGLVLGAGLGLGAVGIFHIAHGLSSLFQAGGAPEPGALHHQDGTSIAVDPLQGGAMVTVTGSMPG